MKLRNFRALAVGTHVIHKASAHICSYIKIDDTRWEISLHEHQRGRLGTHGMTISEGQLIGDDGQGVKRVKVYDA